MVVVLAIRTYAVWNKDKRVGAGLALLLIACQIPNGIFAEKFINSIECEFLSFSCPEFSPGCAKTCPLVVNNPYPEIYRGCLAISGTKIIFINWVVFTVLEGGTSGPSYFQGFLFTGTTITQLFLV